MGHSASRPAGAADGDPIEGEQAVDFDRLARASVTVIGDATLERRVHGRLEAGTPGSLLLGVEEAAPGGGAGIVCALAALGVATAFVCVVGDDLPGAQLTALIGAQANVEPWLLVDGAKSTTTDTAYLDGGDRPVLRTRRHDPRPMQAALRERMLRIAGDAMMATSVTVLSDRGHGTLDPQTARALLAAARQVGRRVIADLEQGGDREGLAGCDLVIGLASTGGADGWRANVERGEEAASILFVPSGELVLRDGEGTLRVALPRSLDPSADYARLVAAVAASVATTVGVRRAVRIAAAIIRRAAPP